MRSKTVGIRLHTAFGLEVVMKEKNGTLKSNKMFSFSVIVVAYILAAALGITLYWALSNYVFGAGYEWLCLLLADIFATVVIFIFSLAFGNASVYDPYWSVQPIVIVCAFGITHGVGVLGALFLAAICIWGVRLTANWAYAFGDLTHQDWRYTLFQGKTGKAYPLVSFVGIHLVPTLVVYGVTMPAVEVILKDPAGNIGSYIFLALTLAVVALQAIADIQMHKFRKYRNGRVFIRDGVWKYSRHPNYFAEILMWWCIGVAMLFALPSSWYLIFGAVANTLLFLFVSIPLAEGKQSTKPGYDVYKKQTRMLLPIYKKQNID